MVQKAGKWLITTYFGCGELSKSQVKNSLLSIVTFLGTIIGILCIVSINAAKSVNGIQDCISALCLIYVGFKSKNIFHVSAISIYGHTRLCSWIMEHSLRKFTFKLWMISIVVILAIWLVSSFTIRCLTNDPRLWLMVWVL